MKKQEEEWDYENIPKAHHALSQEPDSDDFQKYINSDKFTEQDFVDYLSGKYGEVDPGDLDHRLYQHKHATPENVSKVLDNYSKQLQQGSPEDEIDPDRKIESLLEEYTLSENDLDKIITNPEAYGIDTNQRLNIHGPSLTDLGNQENLNEEHINKIYNNHPNVIGKFIDHSNFPSHLMDDILSDPDAINSVPPHLLSDIVDKEDFNANHARNILETRSKIPSSVIRKSFNVLPEEERKQKIDKYLGIEGGHHDDEFNEQSLRSQGLTDEEIEQERKKWNEETNWDNFIHGDGYNSNIAYALSGYDKLEDYQADHLKRHGSFEQKYKLYNNPNIDPKHGAEMFEKWHNDDHHHEYDRDELKEKLREDYGDDVRDDVNEQARENVQDRYPISDFINDYGHEYVSDDDLDHDRMYDNLRANYDWTEGEGDDKIDYSDHSGYDIDDHPEFNDRWDDEVEKERERVLEDWRQDPASHPYRLWENYDEHLSDEIMDEEISLMNEHFENFHENEDFIPGHLHSHIPQIAEIRERRRQRQQEEAQQKIKENEEKAGHLLEGIPNREKEHHYTDGLHHHQMVRDYAEANGGSIDISKMHKMHPNLKDTWKKIFDKQGKLTTEDIDKKIEDLPKTKYNISFAPWEDSKMQNLNGRDQLVVRLDHSDESLNQIKQNEEVYNTFNKIADVSQRSGHPTNPNTIAWARVDTNDPEHWFIDEIQSDFGSTARDYLKREGEGDKANLVQKVIDHHGDWRENLMNYVINTAKKNGVSKISTHSPESKASHTGSTKVHSVYKDSYKKTPKKMGFQKDTHENLPLTQNGKNQFNTSEDLYDISENHSEAAKHHLLHAYTAKNIGNTEQQKEDGDKPLMKQAQDLHEHHKNLAQQHIDRGLKLEPNHSELKEYNNIMNSEGDLYNFDFHDREVNKAKENIVSGEPKSHRHDKLLKQPPPDKYHNGHTLDLNPKIKKAQIDLATDLIKCEIVAQFAQTKEIRTRAINNINLLKSKLQYEENRPISGTHLKRLNMFKGSLQSKKPYKPQRDVPEYQQKMLTSWSGGEEDTRQDIQRMKGNARDRSLHKLHGKTEVRKHPETGERMFLLHRGVHPDEYNTHHQNNKSKYPSHAITSWTPRYDVAHGFAEEYENDEGKEGKVASAWVPESDIHADVNQLSQPKEDQYRNEHEILVSHSQPHHHAHENVVNKVASPKEDIQQRISERSPGEIKNQKNYKKLAASEKHLKKLQAIQKYEKIEKSISDKVKTGLATAALAGSLASQQPAQAQQSESQQASQKPSRQQVEQYEEEAPGVPRQKRLILNSIAQVESSGGKNVQHEKLPEDSIHQGESAYGTYGLTPLLIRETVQKHPDLKEKHSELTNMKGKELHQYMDKYPNLEHKIASKHYDRLADHFGHDPAKIGMAWLNGIVGAKRAINKGKNLHDHWHVKKVLRAYENLQNNQ